MCLGDNALETALRAGTGSEELAAAREHARTCAACRAAMDAAAERLLLAEVAEQGGHPDALALSCYLDGEVSPEARLLLEQHLESCPHCRAEIAGLRRAREEAAARPARRLAYTPVEAPDTAPRRRVPPRVAWPAAAALAALMAWAGFTRLAPGPTAPSEVAKAPPVTVPVQKPAPPAPVPKPRRPVLQPERPAPKPPRAAHLNPAPRPAARPVPAERPPVSSPSASPKPKTMLASAGLPEDPAAVPEWARGDLERLKEPPPVFRGGEAPARPAVALTEPEPGNAAVADPHTAFAWSSVPDAVGYDIRLATDPEDPDAAATEVETATVKEPRYRTAEPLEPGQRYVLTVAPRVAAADADAPATGTFRFRVLTPEQAREAAWAEDNAAKTPVTSAMVLYRLGLYAPARDFVARWPSGKHTDAWAAVIRHAYDRRAADPAR